MAILPIRIYPDPVLREPASPVGVVDDAVRKLIADMTETMKDAPGVGLAAPQVGVQRRVLVYQAFEDDPLRALIDPEITNAEGEVTENEGCLSIPGLTYPVPRAERIVVKALDENGETIEHDAEDFEARVIQHEVDHLNGILYIDRIAPDLRREAKRILRERALGDPIERPRREQSRL
jgi:peptide deformylase